MKQMLSAGLLEEHPISLSLLGGVGGEIRKELPLSTLHMSILFEKQFFCFTVSRCRVKRNILRQPTTKESSYLLFTLN